jgi:hypothetical protein
MQIDDGDWTMPAKNYASVFGAVNHTMYFAPGTNLLYALDLTTS